MLYSIIEEYDKPSTEKDRPNKYRTICQRKFGIYGCQVDTLKPKVRTAVPDSVIYGSIILGLKKLDLWPPKDADNVSQSFNDLKKVLMDLKIQRLPDWPQDSTTDDHSRCRWLDIQDEARAVLLQIGDPLLEGHRIHMKIQNEKLRM
jgi:hypothetical protein